MSGFKSSVEFSFSKDSVSFFNLNAGETAKDSFFIRNLGDEPISWDLPQQSGKFKIISILPATTPGDSSQALIEFLGGAEGETKTAEFTVTGLCGLQKKIKVTAYVKSNSTIAQAPSSIEFEGLLCDSIAEETITIKNAGDKDLILYKAEFSDNTLSNFNIDFPGVLIIPPAADHKFKISFKSAIAGSYESMLKFTSNASNYASSIIAVELKAVKNIVEFIPQQTQIIFKPVPEKKSDTLFINILNSGSTAINWNEIESGYFKLEPLAVSTKAGETVKFRAIFKGGEMDKHYSDSLAITDGCGNAKLIYLNASVLGPYYAVIKAGTISANAGDKVSIPFLISNPRNIQIGQIFNISFDLSYNSTLLIPDGETPIGNVDQGIRKIHLNFPLPSQFNSDSVIAYVDFIGSIGSKGSTPLIISNPVASSENPEHYLIALNGQFLLADSSNLIEDTDKLFLAQNAPNSAFGFTNIKFRLIEEGLTELTLYNINGVKIESLYSQFSTPGDKEVMFNASRYPIGDYFYVLKTPSSTIVKKMQIVR
jgi:hypothetical protein